MIKKKYYYNFFSFISFFLLFFFSFLVYKHFLKSDPSIVNFYNNELSSEFEMDIANNLENLDSFFENYTFIEKYLITRKNSEVDINIQIKEPFAKNQINQEIIFGKNRKRVNTIRLKIRKLARFINELLKL